MSPSSIAIVHGGQHDTKYVKFELLLHATFVADEIYGDTREPARSNMRNLSSVLLSFFNGLVVDNKTVVLLKKDIFEAHQGSVLVLFATPRHQFRGHKKKIETNGAYYYPV